MINNMINAKYFEKFFKDLIVESKEELNENDLINESLDKNPSKKQTKVLEENYARKFIRRYSEDHLNSIRYK